MRTAIKFPQGLNLIVICLLGIISIGWAQEADGKDDTNMNNSPILTPEDKTQLLEFTFLKTKFGEQIWPDFSDMNIPFILYNSQYQFLVGHPHPPTTWEEVKGDLLGNMPYFRRPAEATQAFTVEVGNLWVGSLDTLLHMNHSMEEQLKKRFSENELNPAMKKMFQISSGQHVVAMLHEAFHSFQAMKSIVRFEKATQAYSLEKLYPYQNKSFQEAWNEEGILLTDALKEKEDSKARNLASTFLDIRRKRRNTASLSAELINFEKDLEWLEGLGKYAEMRFAELGSKDSEIDITKAKDYKVTYNRLWMDFQSRLSRLGEQDGDLRFYLSGAVQAFLLDRLLPDWKEKMTQNRRIYLEELLEEAVK